MSFCERKGPSLMHMCHCSSLEQVRAVTAGEQYVPQLSSISTAPVTLSMSPTCHILPEGASIFAWDPGGALVSTVIILVAQVTPRYLILGKSTTAMQLYFLLRCFSVRVFRISGKFPASHFRQEMLPTPSQMNLCGVRQKC